MNQILYSFLLLFLASNSLFAQEKNFIKHTVSKGETITQIATKYKVTPFDIYRLNPDSQAGISESDVILVPTPDHVEKQIASEISKSKSKTNSSKNHIAKPKETLYSISRDYNVDVEELKILNADVLKNGLKIGQTIKIPDSNIHSENKPLSPVVEKENVAKKVDKTILPYC